MRCFCWLKICCPLMMALAVIVGTTCAVGQEPADTTTGQSEDSSRTPIHPCFPHEKLYQPHIVLKNKPYSGVRVSTCEKRLPDGTTYKDSVQVWEWRDSQGRTRIERRSGLPTEKPIDNVTIIDPVAHAEWDWSLGVPPPNFATVVRYSPKLDFVEPEINRRALPNGDVDPPIIARILNPDSPKFKQVILKPQVINGVYSEGDLSYTIADPGMMNNKSKHQEIVSDEFWIAIELEMEVRHISIDPELGKSTENLLNIDQSEPDAKLFLPPKGFKVVDMTPAVPRNEPSRILVLPAKGSEQQPQ